MSVKEARKLLGKEAISLTDEQIRKMITDADELAKLAIQVAKEKRLKEISPEELTTTKTWIREFIFDRSGNEKTFGELAIIFGESLNKLTPELDESDDLRILELQKKMADGNWLGAIELERNALTGNIHEGIHRGIAFLRCYQSGISADKLPKVYLQDFIP
jgi:hypothetical protein